MELQCGWTSVVLCAESAGFSHSGADCWQCHPRPRGLWQCWLWLWRPMPRIHYRFVFRVFPSNPIQTMLDHVDIDLNGLLSCLLSVDWERSRFIYRGDFYHVYCPLIEKGADSFIVGTFIMLIVHWLRKEQIHLSWGLLSCLLSVDWERSRFIYRGD